MAPTTPFIFVVDALDECGSYSSDLNPVSQNEGMRNLLIEQLLNLSRSHAWVKVFVTGRPELELTFTHFDPTKTLFQYDKLHDDADADSDIRIFFSEETP
jgi:hypothetical protein